LGLVVTDHGRLTAAAGCGGGIRAGEIAGVTAEEHEPILARPRELIAVTNPAHAPIVLVEGHVRLTAYALYPERLPDELEILLGVSEAIAAWSEF
jgi:hypothetical protein